MGNVPLRRRRGFYDRLEDDRAFGQEELRQMTEGRDVEQVDWQAVIAKAEQLHQKEQRRLRRSERRWRRRQRRRSRALRRRYGGHTGVYSVNLLSSSGTKNSSDPHQARPKGEDELMSLDDSYSTYYDTATATITDHSSSSANSSGGGGGGGGTSVKAFSVLSSTLQKSPPPQVKQKPGMSKPISVVKTTSTASLILQDLSTMRAATRLSTLTEEETEEPSSSNERDHLFEADFGTPELPVPPVNDLVWLQPYCGRQGRNAGLYIISKVEMKRSNEEDNLFGADFGTLEQPVPFNDLVWL